MYTRINNIIVGRRIDNDKRIFAAATLLASVMDANKNGVPMLSLISICIDASRLLSQVTPGSDRDIDWLFLVNAAIALRKEGEEEIACKKAINKYLEAPGKKEVEYQTLTTVNESGK